MIHEIGVELSAELVLQGCPFPVITGPETTDPASFGRERIVIDYADAPGAVTAPPSLRANPQHPYARWVPGKITIYARAVDAAAANFEHTRRAHHVVDLVLVALKKVCQRSPRRQRFEPGSVTPVKAEALEGSKRPGGAVVELTFQVQRAVVARTWSGAIASEVTIGGVGGVTIVSRTLVSVDGDDTPNNENACG